MQYKDIVNINDGRKLGKIIDVVISNDNGVINKLIIQKQSFFSRIFSSSNTEEILWKQIKKIGEDVILVDLNIKK